MKNNNHETTSTPKHEAHDIHTFKKGDKGFTRNGWTYYVVTVDGNDMWVRLYDCETTEKKNVIYACNGEPVSDSMRYEYDLMHPYTKDGYINNTGPIPTPTPDTPPFAADDTDDKDNHRTKEKIWPSPSPSPYYHKPYYHNPYYRNPYYDQDPYWYYFYPLIETTVVEKTVEE